MASFSDYAESPDYLKVFRFEHVPTKVWYFDKLDGNVVKSLRDMGIVAPTPIQKHSLHAIHREHNVALIGPESSLKSLSYLTIMISNFLKHRERYNELKGNGPLLLILCGSFKSADFLFYKCRDILKESNGIRLVNLPSIILTENDKSKLIGGCHILVTIPAVICSLLSADEDCKLLDKSRLCYVVFEDIDEMLKRKGTSDQLLTILKWRQAVTSLQCILCSRTWTREMRQFLSEQVKNSFAIYIADLMQAAHFINMDIIIKTCSIYEKDAVLIDILCRLPTAKTVVFVSEDNVSRVKNLIEVRGLSVTVVRNGMSKSEIAVVARNWMCGTKDNIFVTDDIVYKAVKISDAKHLVHYDYTSDRTLFHNRFNVLIEAMQSAVRFHGGDLKMLISGNCSAFMIFTDENLPQTYFMSRYFKECDKKISLELEELAWKHEMKKEHEAFHICGYLKSFGECAFNSCRGRHILNPNENFAMHPADGSVDLKIVKVVTANHYFAQVMKYYSESKKDFDPLKPYRLLNIRLQAHFNSPVNRTRISTPNVGMLAVVKNIDETYSRAKLLNLVSNIATIQNLETAEESEINTDHLLVLPEKFRNTPAQAVEIILSNIRPVDESATWQDGAIFFVSRLILNAELKGEIIKVHENTIWINSLKKFNVLTSIKYFTVQFDLAQRLKEKKFAIHNPDHMQLLEARSGKLIAEAEQKFTKKWPEPCELAILDGKEKTTSKGVIDERTIVDGSKLNTDDCIRLQTKEENRGTGYSKSKMANNVSDQRTGFDIQVIDEIAGRGVLEVSDNLRSKSWLTRSRARAKTWAKTWAELTGGLESTCKILTEQLELKTLQMVHVTRVDSPSIFYVRKISMGNELNELNIEINSSLLQRPATVLIGKYYLAPFEPNRYFRSQVIKVLRNKQVEMFRLDVGDRKVFSIEDLKALEKRFLDKLPLQAIPCSMAHMTTYREEAGRELWKQVTCDSDDEGKSSVGVYLMVISKLASGGCQNPMYEVILINSSRSVILNEYLVKKGLAAVRDSTEFSQYLAHLIPESLLTSDQSEAARVLWHESLGEVLLKVMLSDVKKYDLNVEDRRVEFCCLLGSRCYRNNMDLLGPVVAGQCTGTIYPTNVSLRFAKQTPGKWFYLLANNYKPAWLKYNMDYIDVSDLDDSDESTCGSMLLPCSGEPKQINHTLSDRYYELSDSSGSDEPYFDD